MSTAPSVTIPSPVPLQVQAESTRASVLYFSAADPCRRPDVLRSAGFTVQECATFSHLAACLCARERPDLVCISDEWDEPAEAALMLVRSVTKAPVVLFSSERHSYPRCDWDLEVPALTHPHAWLGRIVEMLKDRDRP